jgi:hypothetical protein
MVVVIVFYDNILQPHWGDMAICEYLLHAGPTDLIRTIWHMTTTIPHLRCYNLNDNNQIAPGILPGRGGGPIKVKKYIVFL